MVSEIGRINRHVFLRVFCRTLIITICLGGLYFSTAAQDNEVAQPRRGSRVINDTVKQVYGPKTSKYYFEKDVFYNREQFYRIDTLIKNFHRYNYVQRYNNFYQDLGNMGTAIRPIFYQSPSVIGVNSGWQAYDLYWDAENVKYYDTKSPFTSLEVDLGAKGRSRTRVTFSRNINPRWNFGFTYRGLFVDKQLQRKGKGDRNVRGNYYDVYTAYQSKDSTYRLFLNFRRMKHEVDEYGGVDTGKPGFSLKDYFTQDAQPNLTEASSNDLRTNLHLFHQYKVGKALQLYHQFDQYRQTNQFNDAYSQEDESDYDFLEIDSAKHFDEVSFKSLRNEVGIKGSLLKLFYNGYYAIRNYSMTYNQLLTDTLSVKTKGAESYIGGRVSLKLDSLVEINGWLEVQQAGNFRLEGEIRSKWFEASLKQMLYEPTYVQQAYRGGHDVWNNSFDKVESTWINGYLHYNNKWFSISPGITITRLRNYVYFRKDETVEFAQTVLPVQSDGNQIFSSPEVNISVTMLKHITLSGQGIYTTFLLNSDDAVRLPDLFINAQLSYSNIFFHGNLDMHAGVDLHYKSAYYAMGYDPAIQQFYTQDSFKVPDFPLIDIFFNAKIKRGRIFVKYHNLVQAFTKQGYFLTPEYPGMKNIVDFGFDWQFYD